MGHCPTAKWFLLLSPQKHPTILLPLKERAAVSMVSLECFRQMGLQPKSKSSFVLFAIRVFKKEGEEVRADKSELLEICVGLPWWLSGKQYTCQYRRCGFGPWAWKIPGRRKCQPIPVFLSRKPHGQRSQVGYRPWGSQRVRHSLMTKTTTVLVILRNRSCVRWT